MNLKYTDLLADGVTLVTPSRRLGSLVLDRYGAMMQAQGREVWPAPSIMPLAAWLATTMQALSAQVTEPLPMLLSADQEINLWEQVIARDKSIEIARREPIARLAADAWATCELWRLLLRRDNDALLREETRAFMHWSDSFKRRCKELDAIDLHRYASGLCQRLETGPVELEPFCFFGFAALPPLLEDIANRSSSGILYDNAQQAAATRAPQCHAYASGDAEVAAISHWARERRREFPDESSAIAVAGTQRRNAGFHQRLRRALTRAQGAARETERLQIDCPATVAFSEVGMIDCALRLLDPRPQRDWQELNRLLLSPYWVGARAERDARALLDANMRRNGGVEASLERVASLADKNSCDSAAAGIRRVRAMFEELPSRQRFHDWMRFADELLAAAGWPGKAALNADELAAMNEWRSVLDCVAALDAISAPVSWSLALAKLRGVLRRRRFLAPSLAHSVPILSLDEARFLNPEHLYVAGLSDDAWPEFADINPLLPSALQRQARVPGSNPDSDLDRASRCIKDLAAGLANVQWSFAISEDGTPRRPFSGFEIIDVATSSVAHASINSVQFEAIADDEAYPLQNTNELRGGVSLFADQGACPFRAAARYRLQAQTPVDPTPGLNAMQRGTLVHALMATFWERTGNSTALAAMSTSQRREQLNSCAASVIEPLRRRHQLFDQFWILERERLVALADEWLDLEASRGEFAVVACERAEQVTIGKFDINIRLDRLDRLPSGEQIVIDYKTGNVNSASWREPRVDEPQLPLYAVYASDGARPAIAYAQLKKGKCRIVDLPAGVFAGSSEMSEHARLWDEQLDAWAADLHDISAEIAAGVAAVAPKSPPLTCRYCDLHSLCRVAELQGQDFDAEDDDD